ncbi:aldo/keto reductase [Natronobacterium gregoryi]|uniref:Aldo/keto reductase n=2 Tax=Natronobacterium gregoryi TaxID=44930 RepID=L0ALF9_NATGS|nr:aldo/keto reductase [Natronobacterium gregoryi]AFZ74728.1 aldo/keto reductase, diketogulonate reductase [Natronobacterium gregoryi SP2]ELY73465.1 aldo/keto reductase [Natronobacterium gregoryi SP2]PLK20971.1 aldo/keto reductase [Natronobacterium gregoryi SP2]SFJ03938.1 2,5-diketo-D-gluconate reductase B [Natronobacterium gregoryi]
METDVDDISPAACPTVGDVPMLGLGTWKNDDAEQCVESVRTALEMGYRHVDTAQAYDNEAAVGEGIERADVDREDVYLATKIWISNLERDAVRETARESLERLGVDAVDLLYVHWPARTYDPEETLLAFDDLYEAGLIEGVGVSNFLPAQLEEAVEICDAPIVANQVELHPLLPQAEIRETCKRNDVAVVAYSPLARGAVFDQPEIQAVAEKHGVSEAQVSLAWLRENGVVAIPKATGDDHLQDNWASLALDLEADDRERIDSIDERSRQVDPEFGPWN